MKYLISELPNDRTRIKLKYLRLLERIYIKDDELFTDFLTEKKINQLTKILSNFNAKLELINVHPSNKNISNYKVLNSDKLKIFLNNYIDINQPIWNGTINRVYDFKTLYKHKQPSKPLIN